MNVSVCLYRVELRGHISGRFSSYALSQQGASNLCGWGTLGHSLGSAVSRSKLQCQNSGETE